MLIDARKEDMIGDYNWEQVWNISGTADGNLDGSLEPEPCPPYANLNCSELCFNDIEEVLGSVEGEADEAEWACVVRMTDGRFAYVSAGCDYTGWDCQAGGQSFVAETLEDLMEFGLSDEEKRRLNWLG